jgi:hypothetical protein
MILAALKYENGRDASIHRAAERVCSQSVEPD